MTNSGEGEGARTSTTPSHHLLIDLFVQPTNHCNRTLDSVLTITITQLPYIYGSHISQPENEQLTILHTIFIGLE